MKILNEKQVALWSIVLTALIELVTVLLRFGFKLESNRDTASTIGLLTCGIRLHHGYFGVLIIVLAMMMAKAHPAYSRLALVAGIALMASDLIHHFLVLWPIVGNPEFHLTYPK